MHATGQLRRTPRETRPPRAAVRRTTCQPRRPPPCAAENNTREQPASVSTRVNVTTRQDREMRHYPPPPPPRAPTPTRCHACHAAHLCRVAFRALESIRRRVPRLVRRGVAHAAREQVHDTLLIRQLGSTLLQRLGRRQRRLGLVHEERLQVLHSGHFCAHTATQPTRTRRR